MVYKPTMVHIFPLKMVMFHINQHFPMVFPWFFSTNVHITSGGPVFCNMFFGVSPNIFHDQGMKEDATHSTAPGAFFRCRKKRWDGFCLVKILKDE
jgi:hypothetical protein